MDIPVDFDSGFDHVIRICLSSLSVCCDVQRMGIVDTYVDDLHDHCIVWNRKTFPTLFSNM
jgi:hypothetical protein